MALRFWGLFFNTVPSTPPPPNTVTVTNPGNQSTVIGTPVSLAITATDSDPLQTLTFTATGLPAGLSIDPSTGVISGSPVALGTSPAVVTATDTTGAFGQAAFSWTVVNPGGTTLATSITTAAGTDSFGNAYLAGVTSYAPGGVTNIDGGLTLVYAPAPGAGNLVASLAPAAGADQFGNSFPAGLYAAAGTFSGSLLAGVISAASIGSSAITGSDFSQGTIETTVITLNAAGGQVLGYGSVTVSQVFTSSGSITFPAGTTAARVQAWGPGGDGQSLSVDGGGAGGGGEYAEEPALAVSPGTYAVTVGTPGSITSFPGDTRTLRAHPGKNASGRAGGAGGTGATATIHFDGGPGGAGHSSGGGGGGGSSAGPAAAGTAGAAGTGSAGGAGGTAPSGGGSGGAGAIAVSDAANGLAPGGGGGGSAFGAAGTGASGKVIVTYQTGAANLLAAVSGVAGTDAAGNAFAAGFTGQLTAFHPGSSPAAAETAQAMSFVNSWAAAAGRQACQYLLAGAPATAAAAALSVSGSFTVPAGFAPGQAVTAAAPAGYRPAHTISLIGMDITSGAIARFTWTTGGVLQYNQQMSGTITAGDTIDLQPATAYLGN